ncbi:MAG TPA: MBL fold metallo-hydrolase [Candidatus Nitrosocosmicus sp.]|nr:MBL fold metallo-hydrolase [Candidatus Nitrosocosmicus sp.]
MEIRYLGHASFLLKGKTGTVVTDPFDSEKVGLKFPNVSADIVTISHGHPDHNNVEAVEGEILVLDLPGEFEKKGIRISGFATFHDKSKGEERGKNVVYKIEIDDIAILHCGDLGHSLSDEILEEIGEIQVLLVPVGGVYTIDATESLQIIKQIEPSIVVPMHYKVDGMSDTFKDLSPVTEFLTKMGITPTGEELPKKLILKPEELTEEMKTIVMEAS